MLIKLHKSKSEFCELRYGAYHICNPAIFIFFLIILVMDFNKITILGVVK
jgi:hypothetical protein